MFFAISTRVAEALKPQFAGKIVVAAQPNDEAVLAAIDAVLGATAL